MPIEDKCRLVYITDGKITASLPIQSIAAEKISFGESDFDYPEDEAEVLSGTLSFDVDIDEAQFILDILGVKPRYLNKKFGRRVLHLIKYGKSKRVKNKNFKRSFGIFTFK